VAMLGLATRLGWVDLPPQFAVFDNPWIIGAALVLYVVEFVADKVPWVDSLWDSVHTFIRVPAGAALAFSVFGGDQASWAAAAALLGGTLAATSHAAKTTTRAAVNTSPEPFSNLLLSLAGDAFVPTMLWLAWEHPVWFAVALVCTLAISVVLIVLLFRFLRGLTRRLRGHFQPTTVGEN
jgi:hypothetical protein